MFIVYLRKSASQTKSALIQVIDVTGGRVAARHRLTGGEIPLLTFRNLKKTIFIIIHPLLAQKLHFL